MKKNLKFILILLVTFLAICQTNKYVKAYTTEQWKEIIEYKEVAVDGEPTYSDVEINIDDLEPNPGFPIVQATSELLIYGKDAFTQEDIDKFPDIMKGVDLFDIDFFNPNSENINDSWKNIRKFVQIGFRATLYVAVGAMITQLVYIGILVVKSAVFSDKVKLPYEQTIISSSKEIITNKDGSINRSKMQKTLIEQWLIALLLLIFASIGLSIVINFSKLIEPKSDTEKEMLYLNVYVKDERNSGGSNNRGFYFKANGESLTIFQSQHLANRFAFQDLVLILKAFLTIVLKYIIYIYLILRLIIVGGIIAISPVLVFINNIIRTRGNEGFLLRLFIIFTAVVVSRPIIMALYALI